MTEGFPTGDSIWTMIDRNATLERLAQDESLFGELVDFFLADYGDLLAALSAAVSRADAASVEQTAHRLKGMAANLGAEGLAKAAGELESMGRGGAVTKGAEAEQALRVELRQLVGALREYREAGGGD